MEFKVKLSAITHSVEPELKGLNLTELVAYYARVSNPGNQFNHENAPKLVQYLLKNKHWSPFELISIVMEINTTRDIAHQIIRHRSFAFQEFSQRYAIVDESMFMESECRMQDDKNRQASHECEDEALESDWKYSQRIVKDIAIEQYKAAIDKGIAKEVARKILPEGLTATRLFMSGTLRSWLHYIDARTYEGAQKEHRDIALEVKRIIDDLMR